MEPKVGKKWVALLLALIMTCSTPATVFAEDTSTDFSTEAATTSEDLDTGSLESSEEGNTKIEQSAQNTSASDTEDSSEGSASNENTESEANEVANSVETESNSIARDQEITEDETVKEDSNTAEESEISDYAAFLADLKVLEKYANAYVKSNTQKKANALIINYIRTGVERYTSDSWNTLCGSEDTDFTSYVTEQDKTNHTDASALKNINNFTLPNGNTVDFGHMFGALDVWNYAYTQGMDSNVILAREDLGGWAGDAADLVYCVFNVDMDDKVNASEKDVDTLTDEIRKKYLGVEYSTLNHVGHSFSNTDLYGDLDAFYISTELTKDESASISTLVENYFTGNLTDKERANYFLTNRLSSAKKKATIRDRVYNAYTGNTLINALEASYGVTDKDNYSNVQKASCYAFADWLYNLAGDENAEDGSQKNDDDKKDDNEEPENGYYSVFSNKKTTLAPGVTQDITYALTKDKKQIVYYTATVDLSRHDVNIYANYNNNAPSEGWAMSRVSDQMAAAQKKHSDVSDGENYIANYNAVVGVNADYYNMTTGAPSGALIMNGVEYSGVQSENFFGILKNGKAVIGGAAEYAKYKDQLQEAVGGGSYLVKEGKIAVADTSDYYNNRASRTCVGIKADGSVVMMVLDGRQEPFSAGGSGQEIAQIMYEAGCVTAINLDGGGSTTFDAKQEGSNEVTVVNRPSDGYERSVSSSLLVVSTAEASTEFDHALLTSDTDYLTQNSSLRISATGVSKSGGSADVPEGAAWSVSDTALGSITQDGVFTAANGIVSTSSMASREVTINLTVDGKVVGSKTLTIIASNINGVALSFTKSNMDAIYGESIELPIQVTYNNAPVTINTSDISFELEDNGSEGSISGFTFTATKNPDQIGHLRNSKITAYIASDYSYSSTINIAYFSKDEARFDFDSAMYGDRSFAYNRTVSNSTSVVQQKTEEQEENSTYYIVDPDRDMVTDYTFAIDMQTIQVPDKLKSLLALVAGGDSSSITAWNLMLQLAERVSPQTIITINMKFDENVDVDYDDLKLSTEFFNIDSKSFDKDTHMLTVVCRWGRQTEALKQAAANPVVIVSGIKLTPKNGAAWDDNNRLKLVNSGSVSYDIYLGANALYNMSSQSSFQEQYGIYPYTEDKDKYPEAYKAHPQGGHFASDFVSFSDTYTLDKTLKNGWYSEDGTVKYYKNNVALTGIQKLPGYSDEKNEYYYDLGDDGVYSGKLTGLFDFGDQKYYAIEGELMKGWRVITDENGNDQYYYFDYKTGAAVNGETSVGGHTYTFENCVLTKGAWETDNKGLHYWWAGNEMQNRWFTADGKEYYAYANTCTVAKGMAKTLNHERTKEEWYLFDDTTGEWRSDYSGLYTSGEKTYLVKNGVRVAYPGLIKLGDDFYYINSSYVMIKDKDYCISKTNNLMSAGKYHFDKDGKMVIGKSSDGNVLNGIVKQDNDTWYYYVNGEKYYAGLIKIDNDYYYVNSKFEVIHGRSYFISKTNGLMENASYTFDKDGKMVIKSEGEKLNGIVKGSDGIWYYYVNDVKTYAGLIQIDGNYYYVRTSGEVVHGQSYYVSKVNNTGFVAGKYTFDDDGKMVIEKSSDGNVLNGIVKQDNGTWYYYVNGEKYYAGLIKIDGDYYYVNSKFEVIHGRRYFISKTNGLMENASYTFDSDGKMITE